jgi:hypothetical protein
VLAAPTIPAGVQRVLAYMNARGMTAYGLEVSYFAGELECFVPRVVVRPTLGTRIGGGDARSSVAIGDLEGYLSSVPEAVADKLRTFLSDFPRLAAS